MDEGMRLFVALLPDPDGIQALKLAQEYLMDNKFQGRYTPEENLHMTLAFIGEYADEEHVLEVLEQIPLFPFEITLAGMGRFKDTIWCTIGQCDALSAYVRRLRHAFAEEGIPYDRKSFYPHFTLARKVEGNMETLCTIQASSVSIPVQSISLMCSTPGKHGMIYTEIDRLYADEEEPCHFI